MNRRTISALAGGERSGLRMTEDEWDQLAHAVYAPVDSFTMRHHEPPDDVAPNGHR